MNWITISQETDLSFDFLEENKKKISWHQISKNYPLTKELFERFATKIDKLIILINPSFTMELLDEIKDIPLAMDWSFFSRHYLINEEVYRRFEKYIDIDELMQNENRTIDVIEKVVTLTDGTKQIERIVKEKAEEPVIMSPFQTIHATEEALERIHKKFATLLDKE